MKFAHTGLIALGLLLIANPPVPAQEQEDLPQWKIDPYTENDPERYRAAGYERYHRVMVHPGLGATEVMSVLGDAPLNWVETAHFVIGSSLPEYKIPGDKIQKKRLELEFERLQEKLPELPRRLPRKLDPWLRLHLYAQRCEDAYARVQEVLNVSDEDFPPGPGTLIDGEYHGEGPYLGQKGKYVVLLTQKKSTLHRFATRWCDANFQADSPIMHNFHSEWTMLYGSSPELAEGYFGNDARLHANVIHGLTHMLLNGYKGYLHDLPTWLREGIAHCLVNEVEPRYHSFLFIKDQFPNEKKLWIWEPRVRGLVKNEAAYAFATVTSWMDQTEWRIGHHLNLWARVDYLMKTDPKRFASYVGRIKDRIPVPGGTAVGQDLILERQREAWRECYGMGYEEFDAVWAEWVEDEYEK